MAHRCLKSSLMCPILMCAPMSKLAVSPTEHGITMSNLTKILTDGAILSLFASSWLILALRVNPRIFLHDYPDIIHEKVPQKNGAEKRLTYVFGLPFMLLLLLGPFFSTLVLEAHGETRFWALWLNAAGVMFVFNMVDWLILDWFMFCTLVPFSRLLTRNSLFDP
jgi:hypothetical protein